MSNAQGRDLAVWCKEDWDLINSIPKILQLLIKHPCALSEALPLFDDYVSWLCICMIALFVLLRAMRRWVFSSIGQFIHERLDDTLYAQMGGLFTVYAPQWLVAVMPLWLTSPDWRIFTCDCPTSQCWYHSAEFLSLSATCTFVAYWLVDVNLLFRSRMQYRWTL